MIHGNLDSSSTGLALRRFAEKGAGRCPGVQVVDRELGAFRHGHFADMIDINLPQTDADPTKDHDPRPNRVEDHVPWDKGSIIAVTEFQGDSKSGSAIRRVKAYYDSDALTPDSDACEAIRYQDGLCEVLRLEENDQGQLRARVQTFSTDGTFGEARPDDLGWLLS